MTTATLPQLMTAAEVAAWLAASTRDVLRMARDSTIPAIELPDGSYVFEPAELTAWIAARRTARGGPANG
jgi:plastocyanin